MDLLRVQLTSYATFSTNEAMQKSVVRTKKHLKEIRISIVFKCIMSRHFCLTFIFKLLTLVEWQTLERTFECCFNRSFALETAS